MSDRTPTIRAWSDLVDYAVDLARGTSKQMDAAEFLAELRQPTECSIEGMEAEILALSDRGVVTALAAVTQLSMSLNGTEAPDQMHEFLDALARRLGRELHERT